jgi:translation initiation factor IF-2
MQRSRSTACLVCSAQHCEDELRVDRTQAVFVKLSHQAFHACRRAKPSVELALHADVDGSLEALTESLLALNSGAVVFKVVCADVGAPSAADVQFAQTTGATLVAFGVRVPPAVTAAAQQLKVPVLESECAPNAVRPCCRICW